MAHFEKFITNVLQAKGVPWLSLPTRDEVMHLGHLAHHHDARVALGDGLLFCATTNWLLWWTAEQTHARTLRTKGWPLRKPGAHHLNCRPSTALSCPCKLACNICSSTTISPFSSSRCLGKANRHDAQSNNQTMHTSARLRRSPPLQFIYCVHGYRRVLGSPILSGTNGVFQLLLP